MGPRFIFAALTLAFGATLLLAALTTVYHGLKHGLCHGFPIMAIWPRAVGMRGGRALFRGARRSA